MPTKVENQDPPYRDEPQIPRRQPRPLPDNIPPARIDETMVKDLLLASLEHGDAGEPIRPRQQQRRPVRESEVEELPQEINVGQAILDILDRLDDLTERVLDLAERVGVEIE